MDAHACVLGAGSATGVTRPARGETPGKRPPANMPPMQVQATVQQPRILRTLAWRFARLRRYVRRLG